MYTRREISNFKSTEDSLINFFFSIAVSRETKKNHFPWDSVWCYLKGHKEALLTVTNTNFFCDFFIKVLENHVCEESVVVKRFIDVMTVLLLENETRSIRDMVHFSDRYEEFFGRKRKYDLELSTIYLSEKIEESVFPERECIQVVNALKTGNYRLMQVLATYGCNLKISNDSFFARKVASAMTQNFMYVKISQISESRTFLVSFFRYGYGDILDIPELDSSIENDPKLLNVQPNFYDLVYLSCKPLWRPKSVSFKRLFLLILGMHALWLKLKNNPELINFLKCLDIVFKTISEPYLAVIEVRSLLTDYCKAINNEYLLDEWCKVFEDTIPFGTRNYEPRSLCHLARCQVRENLCKSGSTLPAVIDQMEIPKKIKDFLLCKPCEIKA